MVRIANTDNDVVRFVLPFPGEGGRPNPDARLRHWQFRSVSLSELPFILSH
jgi:hypothetical protein